MVPLQPYHTNLGCWVQVRLSLLPSVVCDLYNGSIVTKVNFMKPDANAIALMTRLICKEGSPVTYTEQFRVNRAKYLFSTYRRGSDRDKALRAVFHACPD